MVFEVPFNSNILQFFDSFSGWGKLRHVGTHLPCGKQDAQVNCRFGPGWSIGYALRGQGRYRIFLWSHKQKALTTRWSWGTMSWSRESPHSSHRGSPESPHSTGPQTHWKVLSHSSWGVLEHRIYTGAGHMENTKESLCTDHMLICETTYTATWKKHLRNFMTKGQNNLHSLCWTLGVFFPISSFSLCPASLPWNWLQNFFKL